MINVVVSDQKPAALSAVFFVVSSAFCVYTNWLNREANGVDQLSTASNAVYYDFLKQVVSRVKSLFGHDHESHAHVQQLLATDNQKIYKFVLTGGPCSGKTTSMERLQVFLRERGFRVFVAPEAATLLFTNGASVDDFARPNVPFAFQKFVIKTQMSLEDSLYTYAKATGQNSVILCDRGIMDGSAYVDQDTWNQILEFASLDTVSAREGRYDAVFHLVTAAEGAERFYSLDNNAARSETPAQARKIDEKTKHAWIGHPRHFIIDNAHKGFETKMQELVGLVAQSVGLPQLTRKTRKYLLLSAPNLELLPNVLVFEVEKVILRLPTRSSGTFSSSGTRKGKLGTNISASSSPQKSKASDGSGSVSDSVSTPGKSKTVTPIRSANEKTERAKTSSEQDDQEQEQGQAEQGEDEITDAVATGMSDRETPTTPTTADDITTTAAEELENDKNGNSNSNSNSNNNSSSVTEEDEEGSEQVLYSFVRKRSQGNQHAYGLTTVKMLETGQKVELKQVISPRMYQMLVNSSADPSREVIRQRRYCFIWKQQAMHIYLFLSTERAGTWMLHCQSEGEPELPPSLVEGGLVPVSDGDDSFSSYMLSKKASRSSFSSGLYELSRRHTNDL